jgi:hypothetical protein
VCCDADDKFVLEYIVKLIKFVQAFEERMQVSQFRPSLSKQRIEYACLVVDAIDAKSLVNIQSPLDTASCSASWNFHYLVHLNTYGIPQNFILLFCRV